MAAKLQLFESGGILSGAGDDVIAGHMWRLAAHELGPREVPVIPPSRIPRYNAYRHIALPANA
jgi:hypothetical protein